MKYLVLRQFTSFGKLLVKGTTVDESEIRSPRLRQSEGKIIPAVPSFEVPEEKAAEQASPQDTLDGVDNTLPTTEDQKPIGGKFNLFFNKR